MKIIINILKKINSFPCTYCLLFSLLFIVYVNYDAHSHKKEISIAVGKESGAYYKYAQQYQNELKKYDVNLKIVTTDGAMETQERLIENRVDFSFVQGGVEKVDQGILALANVENEPIWILYRDKNISSFQDLKGKRINICNPKSGTYPVAKEMLTTLLDVNPKQLTTYDINRAFTMLREGKLDAVFYIIAWSSKSLQEKLKTPNIHILNLKNANAIAKNFIRSEINGSKNSYFKSLVLKQGAISFRENIPNEDKRLLVKDTILVTKNASNKMVRLLLQVANRVHSKEAFFHSEKQFINIEGIKYQLHPASKEYFENKIHRYEGSRLLHFWVKNSYWVAQSLKKIEDWIMIVIVPIALIGFFVEVIYPLIKIFTRRKIDRWYRQINKIDTNIDDFSLGKLRQEKEILEGISIDIHNTDNIDAIHLEAYYSLQHQIKDMIEDFEKRIEKKSLQEIVV